MKNNNSNDEKLRQSAKAVTFFLTGAIIIGALILFFTQTKNDMLLGVVVPAMSLLSIPLIWILYYLIMTICDMENHIYTLNQNFVEYAKHVMKPKEGVGAKSDDKKDD